MFKKPVRLIALLSILIVPAVFINLKIITPLTYNPEACIKLGDRLRQYHMSKWAYNELIRTDITNRNYHYGYVASYYNSDNDYKSTILSSI